MFVHTFAIISTSPPDTVANSLAAHWQTCLNTGANSFPLKSLFPAQVVYNEVTVAAIINPEPPDPRLAAATHVTFTPVAGTGTGGMLPSQCAIAVSMVAGTRPNGVPAKGRFYLPGPSFGNVSSTDGTLAAATRDKIRDTIANWWGLMNASGHRPALWSRTYGTVVGWDKIRVGSTVDTQRRRRNELPEAYSQYIAVP